MTKDFAEKQKSKKEHEEKLGRLESLRESLFFGDEDIDDSLDKSKITSQAEALGYLLNKENVFISGPAGSGKSSVIKTFVELLELESEGDIRIAVTASTGMASSLIEGQTIHSWSGLGISTEPFDRNSLPQGAWSARERLQETDVLIIDEVSMIPLYFFENLDAILKWARRSSEPFGGLQVVLMGDFLQLPPVSRDKELDSRFAVFSEAWKSLNFRYCYLDRIHRSKDKKLLYVLNSIASGKVSEKTHQLLESRMVDIDPECDYTKLYTTNKNVDLENEAMLAKIESPEKKYWSFSTGDPKEVEKAFKKYRIPKFISLKEGAVVMLTKNLSTSEGFYPNGSIGKVLSMSKDRVLVRFKDGSRVDVSYQRITEEKKSFVVKVDENGQKTKKTKIETLAQISYLPLKLGYAITVHKAQGTTIDSVEVDLSNCFTPGLGYVALSRARELDDLVIKGYDDRALSVSPTSSKVSKIVRNKAKKDRIDFKKNKDHYSHLISQPSTRKLKWRF